MGRRSRSQSSSSRSRSRSLSPLYNEGHRVHVADLGMEPSKRELTKHFEKFGKVTDLWVAKNPPCFAFIVYKRKEDADQAVKEMDGQVLSSGRIRVSIARPRTRGRKRSSFDPNLRCYQCGEKGHFSRDCNVWLGRFRNRRSYTSSRSRSRSGSRSRDRRSRRRRSRSKSPVARSRRRSRSRSRRRSRSRSMRRSRSRSPRRSRSKGGRSRSKERPRSRSKDRRSRSKNRSPKKSDSRSEKRKSGSKGQESEKKTSRSPEKKRSRSGERGDGHSDKAADESHVEDSRQENNGAASPTGGSGEPAATEKAADQGSNEISTVDQCGSPDTAMESEPSNRSPPPATESENFSGNRDKSPASD